MKSRNPNIRQDLKTHALRDKNTVMTRIDIGLPRERTIVAPAPFNTTHGHRDLGLIPKSMKHGRRLAANGSLHDGRA
jgi:hypothetical protein